MAELTGRITLDPEQVVEEKTKLEDVHASSRYASRRRADGAPVAPRAKS